MPNLTPLSYGLIAGICLMGILGQWVVAAFPWWQIALAAYLAALTYEWARTRASAVRATVPGNPRLHLGRTSRLAIRFTNPPAIPTTALFAADLPDAIEASMAERRVSLPGQETVDVVIQVRPLAVGRHQWSSLPTRLLGPLGLAWWKHDLGINAEIEVIPDLLGTTERSAGLAQSGAAARQRVGTGREIQHLRPYRWGDPRHTIDWKATARSGELITRVFGEDQHLEIMLIVDAGRTSRTRIDGLSQLGHYINLCARFAEHAVRTEDRIGLIAVTDRPVVIVPPARGFQVVGDIRQALSRITTELVETDLVAAAREMARLVRHRALVVVLTDLYGATGPGRLTECLRMWVPQHLPMVVGMIGSELKTLAERPSRDRLDPYTSLAARTYQADLQLGMSGLRRLGAHTLLALPRDLERAVFRRYFELKAQRRV